MSNPFTLSDEQLGSLLDSYFVWLDNNPKERGYVEKQKSRDESLKKTLLNRDFLSSGNETGLFKAVYDYSRTLEGPAFIRLGEPRIKSELKNIARNILYFIDSNDDPFIKAEKIVKGEYRINIFAGSFWTPLFQNLGPELLPNWNNKTSLFFRELGTEIKNRDESYSTRYKKISDGFKYLQGLDGRHDFYTLNHLMHYATSVPEGKDLLNSMLGRTAPISYWRIIEPIDDEGLDTWTICKRVGVIAIGYENNPNEANVIRFKSMKVGDRVIAYLKKGRIGGIGTIAGDYEDYYDTKPPDKDYFNGYFWRFRKVNWDVLPKDKEYWEIERPYDDLVPGSRMTVYELSKKEFEKIMAAIKVRPASNNGGTSAFSVKTFELLDELHKSPTVKYYLSKREEFREFVERPLKSLFSRVADNLPTSILEKMETKKNIFSKINKNDFGRGGAWDFYWGAFYPKGGKRIEDAQLFIVLDKAQLRVGFSFGEYGSEQQKNFASNCKKHRQSLEKLLADSLGDPALEFGVNHERGKTVNSPVKWTEWLSDSEAYTTNVDLSLPKDEVIAMAREELVGKIVDIYKRLFPLVLLSITADPLVEINSYMEAEQTEEDEYQPAYSVQEFYEKTGINEEKLNRWVRALERKGQAIFYGPPGTGKTYVAEELAKYLVAESNGFWKIVQFHPAYEYEDFIQGIRPLSRPEGTLEYRMVPGRFLEICSEARKKKGICVLIIDEINRGNLARVLGELMYLLEYRAEAVPLAGGNELNVPENLRILGTMNTADRSIALVDHALRRRFAFFELFPDYEILKNYHLDTKFPVDRLIELLKQLNSEIGDRHYHVGITFFLKKDLRDQIEDIWSMEIVPYLEEHFFDQPNKLEGYRWERIKNKILE